ncbi:hypothetical protein D2962_01075 [Biomaibacter acetigenes]|uniref:Uncharacterized protein n=1 Tax=Biomaibacter acetigenes TaxID=2316383 RepID=A0A3G2R1R3_9FIRM|nr:hypothetical protein D2962_01075 [Biomaibacter acetigenes]
MWVVRILLLYLSFIYAYPLILATYFQTMYFSFIPPTHAKKVVPFGRELGKRIKDQVYTE